MLLYCAGLSIQYNSTSMITVSSAKVEVYFPDHLNFLCVNTHTAATRLALYTPLYVYVDIYSPPLIETVS